jgi:sialate O-acetylesterase
MSTGLLRVNPIFMDHMVLQREVEVPIWGTGHDGERVTVRCQGKQVEATVQGGGWNVQLPPMEVGGPEEIIIEMNNEMIVLKDILIGDVWLAGGQSNMEFVLKDSTGAEQEIATADLPSVRFYNVPKVAHDDGVKHVSSWKICSPKTAGQLSAVAYYYAKQVNASQHIPIGIISCNWGGTSASCWMSEQVLLDDPELKIYIDEYREQIKDFDWEAFEVADRAYNQQSIEYHRRLAKGLQGEELGVHAWPPPFSPRSFLRPSGLYETMLRKVAPYALKGALFYQGETDANRPVLYERLLSKMIGNWRDDWNNPGLPFLFVQLPGYSNDGRPDGEDWPLLRESQVIVSEQMPHTGIAVIIDCGEYDDIHPKDKKPVGERLALVGLDRVYGVDIESSGPIFEELSIEQGRAIISFSHVGEGLAARDIELIGFEIGDEQGHYVTASAVIRGNRVEVRSDRIAQPTAVRYGWANYTDANLINSYGLPASPFRSDREGRS